VLTAGVTPRPAAALNKGHRGLTPSRDDSDEEARLRELAEAGDTRAWPRDARPTEVLLIRHAQFDGPEGLDSTPLSDIGRAQSEVLAAFLASSRLAAVYSSPALRALQTAEPIAQMQSLAVIVEPGIREIDVTGPPGSTVEGLVGKEEADRLMALFREKNDWDVFGGLRESRAAFRARVFEAVERIIAANPGGRLALITHSPVIQSYIAQLIDSTRDLPFRTRQTSITLVEAHGDQRQIHAIGARPHLRNL
jgi:probable phosphoglycerate mutase